MQVRSGSGARLAVDLDGGPQVVDVGNGQRRDGRARGGRRGGGAEDETGSGDVAGPEQWCGVAAEVAEVGHPGDGEERRVRQGACCRHGDRNWKLSGTVFLVETETGWVTCES